MAKHVQGGVQKTWSLTYKARLHCCQKCLLEFVIHVFLIEGDERKSQFQRSLPLLADQCKFLSNKLLRTVTDLVWKVSSGQRVERQFSYEWTSGDTHETQHFYDWKQWESFLCPHLSPSLVQCWRTDGTTSYCMSLSPFLPNVTGVTQQQKQHKHCKQRREWEASGECHLGYLAVWGALTLKLQGREWGKNVGCHITGQQWRCHKYRTQEERKCNVSGA